MKSWQDILHGVKKDQLVTMWAPRGSGKSSALESWLEQTRDNFKMIDQGQVDGKPWYTVRCGSNVSKWVRTQDSHQWSHTSEVNIFGDIYDISDELYTLMILKFS